MKSIYIDWDDKGNQIHYSDEEGYKRSLIRVGIQLRTDTIYNSLNNVFANMFEGQRYPDIKGQKDDSKRIN